VTSKISPKTIHSLVKRGELAFTHPEVTSQLKEAKNALVVICIQIRKIHQPLDCAKGIALMNDLIKDISIQDTLKEFQMVQKLG